MVSPSPQSLILASASPRRKELLQAAGVSFTIDVADIIEDVVVSLSVEEIVQTLAREKGEVVAARHPDSFVLSADTVVVVEGVQCDVGVKLRSGIRVLGKPANRAEGRAMLKILSGIEHAVFTGFCLLQKKSNVLEEQLVKTKVRFRKISPDEIEHYLATGEADDKAGAYAMQGLGSLFVQAVQGSYTNVIGLPVVEVLEVLKKYGLWSFPHA